MKLGKGEIVLVSLTTKGDCISVLVSLNCNEFKYPRDSGMEESELEGSNPW